MSPKQKREHESRLHALTIALDVQRREEAAALDLLEQAKVAYSAKFQARAVTEIAIARERVCPDIDRMPEGLRERLATANGIGPLNHADEVALCRRGLAETRDSGGRFRSTSYHLTPKGRTVLDVLRSPSPHPAASRGASE